MGLLQIRWLCSANVLRGLKGRRDVVCDWGIEEPILRDREYFEPRDDSDEYEARFLIAGLTASRTSSRKLPGGISFEVWYVFSDAWDL